MVHAAIAGKSHQETYRVSHKPEMVEVAPARFLMIDGQGDPNSSTRFAAAVQALYAAAYTIKFGLKKAGAEEERVAPLEALWWGAEADDFAASSKDRWSWTLMIRLPEAATPDFVAEALESVAAKKPDLPVKELRVEEFSEGRAAQVMYTGPYSDEGPTIAELHAFIASNGYERSGKHHEIYLGDPRRAAPEKLRTVIRQPVAG